MSDQCEISEPSRRESEVVFLGFALNECTVEVASESARYLRAIHRAALELATQNSFGSDIGGFWLSVDQITQLRSLSDYYPLAEAPVVAQAIEAYLAAQLGSHRSLIDICAQLTNNNCIISSNGKELNH